MRDERQTISQQTKALLAKADLSLKKSLGQNFLTDERILEQIVAAVPLTSQSGVIEIGPGIGALTERLVKRAGMVVGVELDQRLLPVLRQLFAATTGVTFIYGDALEIDYHQLIKQHLAHCQDLHVIANLPYYITSPIIVRLLEERLPFNDIVIMIQREVAERLTAQPKTKAYGSLTLFTQYYASVEKVLSVPRHVFVPRPQVDSMVIRLKIRSQPPVDVADEQFLFRLIRAAFNQRRKTLLNALSAHFQHHISKEELSEWLISADIDGKRRGETLTLEEFARMATLIAGRMTLR